MSLDVLEFDPEVYDSRLKAFMVSVEGEKLPVYLDTRNNPTIGWGFALNKDSEGNWRNLKALDYFLHDILGINNPGLINLSDDAKAREKYWEKQLKDALTSSWKGKSNANLQEKLNSVLDRRAWDLALNDAYTVGDRNLIGIPKIEFKYDNVQQIIATFDLIKGDYNARLNFLGANLPQNCDERIALFSLAYQGKLGVTYKKGKITWESPVRKALKAALNLENAKDARAEAWYAIRYLRGSEPKRGYMEAALFKLYENNEDVQAADARAAYRMFTRHRDQILAYDDKNKAQITQANNDMPLGIAVLPIEQSLQNAKCALIADLREEHSTEPALLAKLQVDYFRSVDIYLNPAKETDFVRWSVMAVPLSDPNRASLMIGLDQMDLLTGGNANDVLIGGAGNDVLRGGRGDDLLCGGADNDTYYIWSNEGIDTIEDKKGKNTVVINGNPVERLVRKADGTYESFLSPDGKFIGLYRDNPLGGRDFVVTEIATGTEVILNEDFQEGDFGIEFYDEITLPDNPVTTNTIQGDAEPIDFDHTQVGIQEQDDQWGNVITASQPDEGRDDTLWDTPDNDLILGGAGRDYVRAFRGGSDRIKGGDGNDQLHGDRSINPIIEGGAGSDLLGGSWVSGSQIFGDIYGDKETLIEAGETAESINEKGDFIVAGESEDDNFLYGSNSGDILLAFGGKDLIVGGGGDDLIISDFYWSLARVEDDWSYTIRVDHINDANVYTPEINGVWGWGPIEDEGDYDVIYAGTGNDFVESGGGDDEVHAGTGDDIVFGDPGDDWIEGGDGDDILDGDNSFVYTSADQQGSDYIDGGSGNDEIWGEGGGRARVRSIKLTLAPMRQRLTMACPGDVYHITSGGNEKKAVIRDTYVRRTSSQYLC